MTLPIDLDELAFRAEARALAVLVSPRFPGAPQLARASGPERLRWFWEELPSAEEIAQRIWRYDARPTTVTPLVDQVLRTTELKRPHIVGVLDAGRFVGADGAQSEPAWPIERVRPRSCVTLIDIADTAVDPAVYRLDDNDPSLVLDAPSYVQYATDVVVRCALSAGVLIDLAFPERPLGPSPLPTFMPLLTQLAGGVWACPRQGPHEKPELSQWIAAGTIAEVVAAFLSLPSHVIFTAGSAPTGPVRSLLFVHPLARGFTLLDGLRRFEAGANTLPPRRIVPAREPAKYRHIHWVGVLDGMPVWCSRAEDARPGIVRHTVDASNEPALRAWATRNGLRPV